jgi:catechol 2,3-dioxygenase-like lactoylglutathione lyase family enzyme
MAGVPKLFRVMLEVADLERAAAFYANLLGVKGRMQRGSRAYFDCGPVILAIVDMTAGGIEPKPNSGDIYFAVSDLEEIHTRAGQLECLSQEDVHGVSAGEIVTRPWGERSFYVKDAWGNGLCFVDETTLFTGE